MAGLIAFIVSCRKAMRKYTDFQTELIFKSSNDLDLFGKLSYRTVEQFEQATSFDAHPVYAVLHEPIYCQGYASAC